MRFPEHHPHSSLIFTLQDSEAPTQTYLQPFPTSLFHSSFPRSILHSDIAIQLQISPKSLTTMQSNMLSASKIAFLALFAVQFSTLSLALAHPVLEQRSSPIVLGLASSFGAIAATTLTSTGATV
jgi:hypothetical protein